MTFKTVTKSIGWYLIGIAVIIVIGLIIGLFIEGGIWIADKLTPLLQVISTLTMIVSVLILLPLGIIKKTRGFAAIALLIASYIFGLDLWIWSLLFAYNIWGIWAIVIGMLMMGVGVVPIAILAAIFNGYWTDLGSMILLLAFVIGARLLSAFLITKYEENRVAITIE